MKNILAHSRRVSGLCSLNHNIVTAGWDGYINIWNKGNIFNRDQLINDIEFPTKMLAELGRALKKHLLFNLSKKIGQPWRLQTEGPLRTCQQKVYIFYVFSLSLQSL